MSIDDQAELAFEYHIDNYGIDWGSNCELFTAGYRAAMRSLYVEMDDPDDGVVYWVLLNTGWEQATCYWLMDGSRVFEYQKEIDNEWHEFGVESSECVRILSLNIPSPAEIFGNQIN